MALSQSVLNELHRELTELRRRRGQIDATIRGLKGILSAERKASDRDERTPQVRGSKSPSPRLGGAGRQVSLRTRVLEIIGAATRPNRTLVVEQLQQEGFQVSGATSLPIRVSHELSRLRRMGVLRRDRNGTFTVPAKPREVAAAQRQPEGSFAAVG